MGRTVPSYRKRCLSRRGSPSGGMATRPLLLDAMVMSILRHQEKMLLELRQTLAHLTQQTSAP